MSGIAGFINLNGAPAELALLHRMTAAIAHRGPDGIRHEIKGSVAMGHCLFCTTPESVQEAQPLWDETRQYCLTLDGRVDNRDELTHKLKSAGAILRDDTDAELVLKAWIAWGEESPNRLIGDFGYVVVLKHTQQVFCVRDTMGIKPLYYARNGDRVLWATELQQLFEDSSTPRTPNDVVVRECLDGGIATVRETLWSGVMRVPPAHYLRIDRRGITTHRYWTVEECKPVRHGNDDEYAQHFLDIFRKSVQSRLRSNKTVAAELSGGVDSSTVVAAAANLEPRIETYSLVFPGLPCDESKYIDAVVDRCGVRNYKCAPTIDPTWYGRCAKRFRDVPDPPNAHMSHRLRCAVAARGRVLLTGLGGDSWFTGDERPRYRRIHKLLPECMLRLPRMMRARLYPPEEWPGAFNSQNLGLQERSASAQGLDLRHPYLDRRVIEFAHGLPNTQKFRNGQTKHVLRRAMRKSLPDLVVGRRFKAEFGHVFDHLDELVHDLGLLEDAALYERGWLDKKILYTRYFARDAWRHNGWKLWNAIAIETWLRNGVMR